jgi:hypothetical protein
MHGDGAIVPVHHQQHQQHQQVEVAMMMTMMIMMIVIKRFLLTLPKLILTHLNR